MSSVTFKPSTNSPDARCDYCFKAVPYTGKKWSHTTNSGSECCLVHLACLEDQIYYEGPTSLCGRHIENHANLPSTLGNTAWKVLKFMLPESNDFIVEAVKQGNLSGVNNEILTTQSFERKQWILGEVVLAAAKNNQTECVQQLDQNLRNKSNGKISLDIITDDAKRRAVEMAIEYNNNGLVEVLMGTSKGTFGIVQFAILWKNAEIVPFLLQRTQLSPEERTSLVITAAKDQNVVLATEIKNSGVTVSERIVSSNDLGWMTKYELLKNDIRWTPVVATVALASAVVAAEVLFEYAT